MFFCFFFCFFLLGKAAAFELSLISFIIVFLSRAKMLRENSRTGDDHMTSPSLVSRSVPKHYSNHQDLQSKFTTAACTKGLVKWENVVLWGSCGPHVMTVDELQRLFCYTPLLLKHVSKLLLLVISQSAGNISPMSLRHEF